MTKASITEQWKPAVGYEGFYDVSDQGRIRSVDRIIEKNNAFGYAPQPRRGKMRKLGLDRYGYPRLSMHKEGVKTYAHVHKIVAEAFIGLCPDGCNQINHKDSDKLNNTPANLEWCDGSHNQLHSFKSGTHTLNLHRCPRTGRVLKKGTKRSYITSRSGYVGVSFNKASGKWVAYIPVNRKVRHIGTFEKKQDAISARKSAEKLYV